jgi:methyl-accepting chemotaxis protein
MMGHWTFGQRIGAGFAVTVILAMMIGIVSAIALQRAVASKDTVIDVNAEILMGAQRLWAQAERKSAEARGFLLTGNDRFLVGLRDSRNEFTEAVARLRQQIPTDNGRRLLEAVVRAEEEHQQGLDRIVALRRAEPSAANLSRVFDEEIAPLREQVETSINALVASEEQLLRAAEQASTDAARFATGMIAAITIVLVVCAAAMAFALTRLLGRQIGAAIGQVQSSSSELQAAASQQATGAKEQATTMSEISTTISELLATSRQITDSAQRVAQVAAETARSARTGEETVERTRQSMAGIRRQVDLIVSHMLELGKKSQHIGAVLDIVSELAEQTNILAINATIEAAGAGESGRRFAIVADEIRKLADRVGSSTKEIRTLIEDVRGAVNTTVMATEAGSKIVEAGSNQFDQVASSFKQIAASVITATEAAREIELSTKQQTTAVEQVNVAMANIAQASSESAASSTQTLQTASQLAGLSQDLLRIVRPQVAA